MKNPLLPYALLLALGIALSDAWPGLSPGLATTTGALLTLGAIALQWRRKSRWQMWCFGVAMGLAVVCVGYARMSWAHNEPRVGTIRQCYALEITSTPTRTAHTWRSTALAQGEKVMLYFDEPPRKGDKLLAYCQFREPAKPGNPHQFDYQRYLRRQGIRHAAFLQREDYVVIEKGTGGMQRLRDRMFRAFENSSLTPHQRGVAEALVMGYDSDVDSETLRLFRNAGIVHLLCVSGLHVGIVAAILASLLFWIVPYGRGYRHVKGVAQIAGIWFFAAFTGWAPSTVRAATMLSFVIVGRLTSQQRSPLNTLAATALLMLMIQPGQLFDIGFQLSFAAVAGIILFYGMLANLWNPRIRVLRELWSLACISLATQITCTPILLYYFHQFPPYFLIANILIVPFAGLILGSSLVLALTAWWPWLFGIVAKIVGWELVATDWVTHMVSALPGSMLENVCFPPLLLWISLAIILLLALRRYRISIVVAVGLTISAIAVSLHNGRQESLIVYSTPRCTAIEHLQGHRSTLYLSDSADISYQRQGHIVARGIRHTDTLYGSHLIHYKDKTLYLIDRENLPLLRDTFPVHVDYLIVSETPWLTPPELRALIPFDTLLFAANNSQRSTPLWHALCRRDSIPYHDIAISGSKILN